MYRSTVLVIVFLISTHTAYAQGPPIYTDTPIFLGLEGRGFRTFGKYISKENSTVYAHPIAIPYNIKTKAVVGFIAPFIRISPEGIGSESGLGDISVFLKYLIVQKDYLAKTFRIALKFSETFPTGDTDSNPVLGLGANQSFFGLVGAFITTRYGVYSEIGYNAVNKNLPDNLVYNIAVGYPILPVVYPPRQLNVYLELNGNTLLDVNKTTLFLSPGIQVIPGRRFLIETGFQIPVKEDVPSARKTNFVFTFGTRILIF